MLFVVGLLASSGCRDTPVCEQHLAPCDIGDEDCRVHVFEQTACAREFDAGEVPVVETITRDELRAYLGGDAMPTDAQKRADAQLATAQRMLWLLAADATSNDGAAIDSDAKNILAFYSSDDKKVRIVSTNLGDADDEQQTFVLSHEFTHAMQDEQFDLGELFGAYAHSRDSEMALRGIIEGEAVNASNLTMARRPGLQVPSAAGFTDYYRKQQRSLEARAADPSMADFNLLVTAFPYPYGGEYVTDHWLDGGQDAVDAVFDDPPPSTTAILRTNRGVTGPSREEVPLAAEGAPDGWAAIDEDVLGGWLLFAVALRGGIEAATANNLALSWRGDHRLVMGGPTETDVAQAWRVRFDDGASATTFAAIAEVAPPEGVRSVVQDGADVTIVTATDQVGLDMWTPLFVAATPAPGGELRARSTAAERRRRIHAARP